MWDCMCVHTSVQASIPDEASGYTRVLATSQLPPWYVTCDVYVSPM